MTVGIVRASRGARFAIRGPTRTNGIGENMIDFLAIIFKLGVLSLFVLFAVSLAIAMLI